LVRGDYQREILEWLSRNGGCVTGFRKLAKDGGFKNSNMLRKHLHQLVKKEMIFEDKINNRKRFCLDDFDFHDGYKMIKRDLRRLDTFLYRKDLGSIARMKVVMEIVKMSTHQLKNTHAYLLHAMTVQHNEKKIKNFEMERDALVNNLNRAIMKLNMKEDRERVINLMFESEGFVDFEEFKKDLIEISKRKNPRIKKRNITSHGK